MKTKRVVVAGDSGLLGQSIVRKSASTPGAAVLGVSSNNFKPSSYWPRLSGEYRHLAFDLTKNWESFESEVEKFEPDLIVNCIALVNLAKCESDVSFAKALNVDTAEKLAALSVKRKTNFVHVSTDQVFDGEKSSYAESDSVHPLNMYGKTKEEAERIVMAKNTAALVLRTNIVGYRDRASSPTFAEWLVDALQEQEKITLFTDYVTSSLHVDFFTDWMFEAIGRGLTGVRHLASHDAVSKFDFGKILASELGVSFTGVAKGLMKNTPLSPPRPLNLKLNVSKIESEIGRSLPSSVETIKKLAKEAKIRAQEGTRASAGR